jgi:peptide deformylase
MSLLTILHYPNPILRLKAEPVTEFNPDLQRFIDAMFATMYEDHGIGLAATQVNIQEQVIVIDVSPDKTSPYVFINPKIIEKEGEADSEEGCLSVPGAFATVKRAARIRVKALDRYGKPFELDADGLFGYCIQHEMDHLDGKLFIDRLSRLKRERVLKKLKILQKETM